MALTYKSEIQLVEDIFTFKYFTIGGIVVLFYDHLLTISDERQYVWKAPPSIEKYAFLLNRYLVFGVLLATLHEIFNFNASLFTNRECQLFVVISSFAGTVSTITANFLILHRVLDLWKDDKKKKIFLYSVHVASSCVTISLTIFTYWKAWPGIQWFSVVKMCVPTIVPPSYPIMWGAPLFFEFSVFALVVYNTLATPRSAVVPLRQALLNNGITFFLTVILLRLFNMVISSAGRRTLAVLGVFFIWAGITTFLNRSILRLREAEMKNRQMSMSDSGSGDDGLV